MSDLVSSGQFARAQRVPPPKNRRLERMRFLSRLLDNSILLPGGYRIGLDPVIGLLPAVGDFVSATLSFWLIYDAARLGISKKGVLRMFVNVVMDSMAGSVPVVGDLVDAVWKANARNMALVEAEYRPDLKERPFGRIAASILGLLLLVWGMLFGALYLVLRSIMALFS